MRKHVYDRWEQQRRRSDCVSLSPLLLIAYKVHTYNDNFKSLYLCSFDLCLTWSETLITFFRDKTDLFIPDFFHVFFPHLINPFEYHDINPYNDSTPNKARRA